MEGLRKQMDWKGGWDGEREDFGKRGEGLRTGGLKLLPEKEHIKGENT